MVGVLIGAAYYVTAQLSLELALVEENVTPLWPPTGIAVASFFLFGKRMWPGIAVAAFAVNLPISDEPWAAVTTAAGNTLAPLLCVVLLERAGFDRRLARLTDAVTIVWTALVTMTVSATVGSLTLLGGGVIDGTDLPAAWSVWWAGDAMGVLVVAPFILTAPELATTLAIGWRVRLEVLALLLAVLGISLVVLQQPMDLLFLILVPVGVAAWRFQQAGATPSALIASSVASYGAARSLGPFDGTVLERMLTLQAFDASVALASFVFAALVTERIARRAELEELNAELEGRVEARTAALSAANARLAMNERRLAEAQAIASVGSWEWDLRSGAVAWSRQMYDIHGLPPSDDELSFEDVMPLIAEDDVPRVRKNVEEALRARRGAVPPIEYHVRMSDGALRPVLGTGRIIFDGDVAVRMVGTVQDLTERQERQRDHRIADRLQRALLPRELTSVAGVELAAHYQPAESDLLAGGDWYDTIAMPDGRLAVVIGDVAGHGLDAATVMGQVRMAVRASLVSATDPSDVAAHVDRVVQRYGPAHMSTMLLAIVDRERDLLEYASAGHLPPALADDDGCTYLPVSGDPPLGVERDHRFRTIRHRLLPGSTLVLFTDGLVDRRGANLDEELGRVLEIIADRHGELADLGARLLAELLPGEPEDDVAILTLRSVRDAASVLRVDVPARAAELAFLRESLRTWLEAAGVDRDTADDLILAANEAATNVIEHANPPDGAMLVEARIVDDRVEIDIDDAGTWREPRPTAKGRGFAMIRAVTDDFEVSTGPTGTRIALARRTEGART